MHVSPLSRLTDIMNRQSPYKDERTKEMLQGSNFRLTRKSRNEAQAFIQLLQTPGGGLPLCCCLGT